MTVCYSDSTYTLDLCEKHAEMFELELRGWLRLARVTPVQHHRKWVPGELSSTRRSSSKASPTPVPEPVSVEPEPPKKPEPAEPVQPPVRPPMPRREPEDQDEPTLLPTDAGLRAMAALGIQWAAVVEAVDTAFAVTPSQREGVTCYLTQDLSVLVADNGAVIGVARRSPQDPLPATSEPERQRILRKGKRGGQGRIGPRTMEEVIAAVRATPGWEVDDTSRRHIAVTGPQGQRTFLPRTTSDHRAALNSVASLRQMGLDLRAAAS